MANVRGGGSTAQRQFSLYTTMLTHWDV